MGSIKKFSEIKQADSIVHKWNNKWSYRFKALLKEHGIESGKGFRNFIKWNTLSKEEKRNKELAGNLKKER